MFGARRDGEGIWRLCEKRGRLITRVSSPPDDYPIAFLDREAADGCAEELNVLYWDRYKNRRQGIRGYELQHGILSVVSAHGGLSHDDLLSAFVP